MGSEREINLYFNNGKKVFEPFYYDNHTEVIQLPDGYYKRVNCQVLGYRDDSDNVLLVEQLRDTHEIFDHSREVIQQLPRESLDELVSMFIQTEGYTYYIQQFQSGGEVVISALPEALPSSKFDNFRKFVNSEINTTCVYNTQIELDTHDNNTKKNNSRRRRNLRHSDNSEDKQSDE